MPGGEMTLAKKGMLLLMVPVGLQLALTAGFMLLQMQSDHTAYEVGLTREESEAVSRVVMKSTALIGRINESRLTGKSTAPIKSQAPPEASSKPMVSADENSTQTLAGESPTSQSGSLPYSAGASPFVLDQAAVSDQQALHEAALHVHQMHPEKGFDGTKIDELDRLSSQLLSEAQSGKDTTQTKINIERLLQQPVDPKQRPQFSNPAERRAQRSALMTAITAGTVLNVLALIALGLFFLGSIVERLRIVLDNTIRLSSGKQMHAPLPGSDELADVDHQFHKMSITLKESEHRQAMLLKNARDVICSVDESLKFQAVSNASANIFGIDSAKLQGQSMLHILPGESIKKMRVALAPNAPEQEFEMEVRRPNGEIVETLWSAQWSPADRLSICVVHDNTERKAAERLRKEILEMVSHDLRSPLATIGGFHSLLQTGKLGQLNEQGSHFLNLSIANTNRMLALVNDLLDAEMIRSGMLQIQTAPTGADAVMQRSAETVKVQANSKSITIQVAPCGLTVNGDVYRLEQIVVNLLTNAVKFSPERSTISVGAQRQGNFACFYVADQGRGIPKEAQPTIFERFTQSERSDAKRGSGLGLWICKALVELHGGTIALESEPGRGTTFKFTIPLA